MIDVSDQQQRPESIPPPEASRLESDTFSDPAGMSTHDVTESEGLRLRGFGIHRIIFGFFVVQRQDTLGSWMVANHCARGQRRRRILG